MTRYHATDESDSAYYARRAEEERRSAVKSPVPEAKEVHERMAEMYACLAFHR